MLSGTRILCLKCYLSLTTQTRDEPRNQIQVSPRNEFWWFFYGFFFEVFVLPLLGVGYENLRGETSRSISCLDNDFSGWGESCFGGSANKSSGLVVGCKESFISNKMLISLTHSKLHLDTSSFFPLGRLNSSPVASPRWPTNIEIQKSFQL